jgi:hypothetical protein
MYVYIADVYGGVLNEIYRRSTGQKYARRERNLLSSSVRRIGAARLQDGAVW